jgi:hypothetical protein
MTWTNAPLHCGLRETIFLQLFESYDSERKMPDIIIAVQGWCSEHELYLELLKFIYGKTVFELYGDNI